MTMQILGQNKLKKPILTLSTLSLSLLSVPAFAIDMLPCPLPTSIEGEQYTDGCIIYQNDPVVTVANAASLTIYNGLNIKGGLENAGHIINQSTGLWVELAPLYTAHLNNLSSGIVDNYGSFWSGSIDSTKLNLSYATEINNAGLINNYARIRNLYFSTFNNSGTVNNEDSLQNQALISNSIGGSLLNKGQLVNAATGIIRNAGNLENDVTGKLTNEGEIDNQAGTLTNLGQMLTTGALVNNKGAMIENIGQFSSKSASNGGQFINSGQLQIGTPASGIFGVAEGSFSNNGQLTNSAGGKIVSIVTVDNKSDGEIDNFGEWTIEGTGKINNAGKFVNQSGGLLTNQPAGVGTGVISNLSGGQFINAGTINNGFIFNNYGEAVNQSDAAFNNASFTNQAGGHFVNAGVMTNRNTHNTGGYFQIAGGGVVQGSTTTSDRFIQSAGTTQVDGLLQADQIQIDGGTLSGTGTVESTGDPISIGGLATVDPGDGNGIGTLTMLGDVGFGGKLHIDFGSETAFDVLKIAGTLNFLEGYSLELRFSNAFRVTDFTSLTFLDATAITGPNLVTASLIGLPDGYSWEIGVNKATGDMSIDILGAPTTVPLPSAVWLFGSTLLAWLGSRNRRFAMPAAA